MEFVMDIKDLFYPDFKTELESWGSRPIGQNRSSNGFTGKARILSRR